MKTGAKRGVPGRVIIDDEVEFQYFGELSRGKVFQKRTMGKIQFY